MTRILHIDSSSRTASSITRQLSKELVEAFKKNDSAIQVKYRDLTVDQPAFITETEINAVYTPAEQRSPEAKKIWEGIKGPLQEFLDADVYVFGVPMYNFSVPAIFKAFIDRTVIAGETFQYSAEGLKPLVHGKKAYVLTASGGNYDVPPFNSVDFLEPYLRGIFGFIGVTDITFIKVPGHSEEEIKESTAKAQAKIAQIAGLKTAAAGV